jgi:hypothetical protein
LVPVHPVEISLNTPYIPTQNILFGLDQYFIEDAIIHDSREFRRSSPLYTQVCGLESIPARTPSDYENCLINHSNALRKDTKLKNAVFVVCPEANLGFESSHIARIMRRVKFTVLMYETKNEIPGMLTTHQSKEVMCSLLSDKLDQDAVMFHENVVCTCRPPAKIVKELCTQVQNYNIVYAVPDKMQHFQFSKKTYSGKHHGNDDLAVMLQFNILAYNRFFKSNKYNAHW